MVNENVGSVLQTLVTNNARVGKQAIVGYRTAAHYVVGQMDDGFKNLRTKAPKARLGGKALGALGTAGGRLAGYYAQAFDRIASGAEKVIVQVDRKAADAIGKATTQVANIGNRRTARYIEMAGQASLPPLKLARDVSAWIATRAERRLSPRSIKRSVAKKGRKTAKFAKRVSRAA
jgi:hypothetical protein